MGLGDSSEHGPEQRAAQGDTFDLGACFERARPILQALVSGVDEGDTLVVATDQNGFPVAQKIIPRPEDLPRALVVGRHNRCGLTVPGDNRVSLRHLLLTFWSSSGPVRFRGYDLGGRAGVVLADGKRVPGFASQGHVALSFGRTGLFVLPGGPAGVDLLAQDGDEAYRRLTGLALDGQGQRLALTARPRPGVAQLDGHVGGYRALDVDVPPQPRGELVLRTRRQGRGEPDRRAMEVNAEQLERGLLIGRYSDRCSLAGSGRNLSRVHALVIEETPGSLLVFDLASTNGVRPNGQTEGPSHPVVRLTPDAPCMLGHFELGWVPSDIPTIH